MGLQTRTKDYNLCPLGGGVCGHINICLRLILAVYSAPIEYYALGPNAPMSQMLNPGTTKEPILRYLHLTLTSISNPVALQILKVNSEQFNMVTDAPCQRVKAR